MDSFGPLVDDLRMNKDLGKTAPCKGSLVTTMRPYTPNSSTTSSGLSRRIGKKRQEMIEILPGAFEPNSFNKYLTFNLENEKKLCDVNIFEINKMISSCIGREPKISREGESSLLIEVETSEESEKLQTIQNVQGNETKCFPHKTLNQCRGVVFSKDLVNYPEEMLKKEFEDQKVVEVKRIYKKENGSLHPTPTLILKFDLLKLPNILKAAWLRLPVRPYIPLPRRCYYCQRFGHFVSSCRRKLKNEGEICANCGQEAHGECQNDAYCINCKGNHSATSKQCSKYLFEKDVLALKVMEKISFKEAKQRVMLDRGSQVLTYAEASNPARNAPKNKSKVEKTNNVGKSLKEDAAVTEIVENMEVNITGKRRRSQDSLEEPALELAKEPKRAFENQLNSPSVSREGLSDGPPTGSPHEEPTGGSSPQAGGSMIEPPATPEDPLESSGVLSIAGEPPTSSPVLTQDKINTSPVPPDKNKQKCSMTNLPVANNNPARPRKSETSQSHRKITPRIGKGRGKTFQGLSGK